MWPRSLHQPLSEAVKPPPLVITKQSSQAAQAAHVRLLLLGLTTAPVLARMRVGLPACMFATLSYRNEGHASATPAMPQAQQKAAVSTQLEETVAGLAAHWLYSSRGRAYVTGIQVQSR